MLRYFSRFALSRVASPLPREEVLKGLLFLCSFSATRTRNAIVAERRSTGAVICTQSVREIVTFAAMKFAQSASDIAPLSQLRNI